MSTFQLLPTFVEGHYRILMPQEVSFSEAQKLFWSIAMSDDAVVQHLEVFPTRPLMGHCVTTAPLELDFENGTFFIAYGMNTEGSDPSDFEPIATVEIDDVFKASCGSDEAKLSMREIFAQVPAQGGEQNADE